MKIEINRSMQNPVVVSMYTGHAVAKSKWISYSLAGEISFVRLRGKDERIRPFQKAGSADQSTQALCRTITDK